MSAGSRGRAVKHGWKERCGTRRGYLMSICRRMPITRQPYFLPTQISNCSLWLDSADLSSFTLSGSSVTQWRDKSGSNNNATPYSTGPQRVGNSVLFSGGNALKCGAFLTSTSCSVFIVNNYNSGVIAFGCWKVQYGSAVIFQEGSIRVGVNNTGAYAVDASTSTASYTTNRIYGLTLNSSSTPGSAFTFNGSIDGTNVTISGTSTLGNAATCAQEVAIGGLIENGVAYYPLNGYVYEVIVYNIALTSTQRQQIEGYLAQKWGLTGSLPAGHPGLTSLLYRNLQTTFTKKQYFTAFSPRQIGGCILWLDAADASSVTTSGTTVTAIRDKSARATVLTSPAGFTYPNNIFNGAYPSFYNTSASGGRLGYNTTYSLGSQNTVFIVGQLTSPSVGNQFFDFIDGYASSSRFFLFSSPNNLNNYVYGTNGSSSGQVNGAITTAQMTSPFFWSVAFDTSTTISSTLQYVNGTQLVQSPSTLAAAISSYTGIIIGQRFTQSSESVVGHICEFIIFDNVLTATQRQQVESYLAQKWGLVSSLPAGHLNTTFPAGSPTVLQAFVPSIRPAVLSIPFIGGGSASSSGIFSIRTFLTTGQLILSKRISATILVVGGGGGGGSAGVQTGGGGAGGAVFVSSPVTITPGIYTVTVGTGGGINTNGTNSTFLSYTGVGGGGGGNWINGAGKTGGCGGGGSGEGGSGAAGSQGFGGANGRGQFTCGGGGGGMGQAGKQPADGSPSSGGNGLQYSITGSSVYYAGGGAGGFNGASTGGLGGGGDKTLQGTDGLGGGGGSGERGGNGVVILSFVFL